MMGRMGSGEVWRADGYAYRAQLVTILNCTHLEPHDRGARTRDSVDRQWTQSGPFEGTLKHYAGFRFVLAVENTQHGSPVSEKIINAYLSQAVPIVWGGGLHRHVFNPSSFVDCTDKSAKACAEMVRAVDGDEAKYETMRGAPRFASRQAFDNFFAWSAAARGSSAQQRLHDTLLAALATALNLTCGPRRKQSIAAEI